MNEIILPYQLELKTASPLHIGSNPDLKKNPSIITERKVYFIDENKLIEWISRQRDSEGLAKHLVDSMQGKDGLDGFIRNYHVKLEEISSYSVALRDNRYHPADRYNTTDISPFIKTIQNEPYIPGSSLKGSLRSSLLRGLFIEDEKRKEAFEYKVIDKINRELERGRERGHSSSRLRINFSELERRQFVSDKISDQGKYSYYDLNRCLMIRDSQPFPVESLHVATAMVLSVKNNQRDARLASLGYKLAPHSSNLMKIPIEAIGENASTVFSLVWQTYLLAGMYAAEKLNFKEMNHRLLFLPEYCRLASANIIKQEINFYQRYGYKSLEIWFKERYNELQVASEDTFLLPLGWGSGFDAKTVTDLLDRSVFSKVVTHCNNTIHLGKPSGSDQWLGVEDSPKSRKVVVYGNDEVKPLGWVWITLKPLEEGDNWLKKEREKHKASISNINLEKLAASTVQASPVPQKVSQAGSSPTVLSSTTKPEPSRKIMINEFKELPKVGDKFYGEVFDYDSNTILVKLGGLDPDEIFGRITKENNRANLKPRTGTKVICEVIEIKKDRKETIVDCRIEKLL